MGFDVNKKTSEIEISALIDEFTYLDVQDSSYIGMSLSEIMNDIKSDMSNDSAYQVINSALEAHPEYGNLVLSSVSCLDGNPLDDPIEAVAFVNNSDTREIYVSYRGTGDGRWLDDGVGIIKNSICQIASVNYFDRVCAQLDVTSSDKVVVGGHSKGGNEAYYANAFSINSKYIDACIPIDGQGFSDAAFTNFYKNNSKSEQTEVISRIISINGENDFVNPLGNQLIDESEKFYVKQGSSDGFMDFHSLDVLLARRVTSTDKNGNEITDFVYDGITNHFEKSSNGALLHGEPSEFSLLIKDIYADLKDTLTDEEFEATVREAMLLAESKIGDVGNTIGSTETEWSDSVYFVIAGVPILLSAALKSDHFYNYFMGYSETDLSTINNEEELLEVFEKTIANPAKTGKGIMKAVGVGFELLYWGDKLFDWSSDALSKISFIHKLVKSYKTYSKNHSYGSKQASVYPFIIVNPDELDDLSVDIITSMRNILSISEQLLRLSKSDDYEFLEKELLKRSYNKLCVGSRSYFILSRSYGYLKDTAEDFRKTDSEIGQIFGGSI